MRSQGAPVGDAGRHHCEEAGGVGSKACPPGGVWCAARQRPLVGRLLTLVPVVLPVVLLSCTRTPCQAEYGTGTPGLVAIW